MVNEAVDDAENDGINETHVAWMTYAKNAEKSVTPPIIDSVHKKGSWRKMFAMLSPKSPSACSTVCLLPTPSPILSEIGSGFDVHRVLSVCTAK